MSTNTSPDYLADVWDLGLDLARHNSGIDLERPADTRNVPDNVDLKTGNQSSRTSGNAGSMKTGGFSMNWKVAVIGVVGLGIGAVLFKKAFK